MNKIYAILELEMESSYQTGYLNYYCYVANSEEDIVKDFRENLYSYFDYIPKDIDRIVDFDEMRYSSNYDLNDQTEYAELSNFKIYYDPHKFYIDVKKHWNTVKNPDKIMADKELEDVNFIYSDLTTNKSYHTARVIMTRDLDDMLFKHNMDFMTTYGVVYDPYKNFL